METKIRRSVFETNSSSTHSIAIVEGDFSPDFLPVKDGVCEIHTGEFGWEVEDYYDAATKAAYCLTWLKQQETRKEDEEQMLIDVIMENTGAKGVRFIPAFTLETKGEWDFYQWGYIDHQSENEPALAFKSKKTLAAFIFNPESGLHTDNDNY